MSTNAARITEISVAHSYSEFDPVTGEILALVDRFQNTLDTRATELLNSIPGIETLTALVAIDPEDLSRGARVDYLSAVERQTGWLQALIQRAIVAVAGAEPSEADGI